MLLGSIASLSSSLFLMSAVELDADVMAAAQREADRRGVEVAVVVNEAVQRFVAGSDLRELFREWRERDSGSDAVDEATALRIANEELNAYRRERG